MFIVKQLLMVVIFRFRPYTLHSEGHCSSFEDLARRSIFYTRDFVVASLLHGKMSLNETGFFIHLTQNCNELSCA